MKIAITADVRVGDLLAGRPELEGTLGALLPAWSALRNPVLRRAVVNAATLEQAARSAGVGVADLVRGLRRAAGEEGESESAPQGGHWLEAARIEETIDADTMLKTGVHPVGRVKQGVANLTPGTAIELASSFRPQPLIDMMRGAGYAVWTVEPSPGRHLTRFGRTP